MSYAKLKLMPEDGIRGDVAMCSKATRTCAYARVAHASGTTRSSVGLYWRGRADLGQRVQGPGGDTVIRGHCASLACSRDTDVVYRRRIAVITPEMFVEL